MGRYDDDYDGAFGEKKHEQQAPSVQWGVVNGAFQAAGATLTRLPAGAYEAIVPPLGAFRLEPRQLFTDGLFDLHASISHPVVARIRSFWASAAKFHALRQLHKRGILFTGSPGTGKSSIVMMLALTLIEADGIILLADRPGTFSTALRTVREIEPSRPIICLMEDIDRWAQQEHAMQGLLSLLDGEDQVDNVVYLATTNFPELLDGRLLGRPSRFDEIVALNLPHPELRSAYLRACMPELPEQTVAKWVADSEGMNFGHLREMLVATQALGCAYEETLARLRSLMPAQARRARDEEL